MLEIRFKVSVLIAFAVLMSSAETADARSLASLLIFASSAAVASETAFARLLASTATESVIAEA
ncbi:hypothetical protein, partial [Klebsiella quasipneumoniae]|uniref:hypothetical protein n=1 Tax=Klebsiella quasipneumoniae TaxID=1463165 RepID=UPI0024BE8B5F